MTHAASSRARRFGRWLAVLALSLIIGVCVGAVAQGQRLTTEDIGATLSTVRDSSLDAALATKVRSALALSRRVSGTKLDVGVRSGVVSLSGRVPSREARSIVEAIAHDTPGVLEVRNHLVVDARAAATGFEQTLLQRIADLETEVAVQERLRQQPRLAWAGVRVDVERGLAVLRGEVESEAERAAAQRIAETVVGADYVRNELRSLGSAQASEDRLVRRVEFELYRAGAFDVARIQVTGEGGRIRLTGGVRSEAERLLAGRVAGDVPGVLEVVNELALEESPGRHGAARL